MKLVVAIVHADDAGGLEKALTRAGHGVTNLKSAGGFCANRTPPYWLACPSTRSSPYYKSFESAVTAAMNTFAPCLMLEPGEMYMPYGMEVEIGGATVFVLDVDRFEKF
jgi:uncharacterized protein YaaQ